MRKAHTENSGLTGNPDVAGHASCSESACGVRSFSCGCGWRWPQCCGPFARKLLTALVFILLVYVIVWVATMIRNNLRTHSLLGMEPTPQHVVTIAGEGKVTATPNIAFTDMGMITEKKDVASTQKENSAKMDALIGAIKLQGIANEDIQTTQYQIYPRYSYEGGKSVIIGYTVSQSARIKIRDLSKINDVLGLSGSHGANQVSGVRFTIDDPEQLQSRARELAIQAVQKNAASLASQLGVRLGRIVSFSEQVEMPPQLSSAYERDGVGGAGSEPSVYVGSLEVRSQMSVTYEVR